MQTLKAEGVSNVQLVLVEGRPGVTIDTAAILRGFDIDLCGVGFPMTADSVAVHRLPYTLLPGLHDKLTCLQLNGAASTSEATVLPSLRITSFGRIAGHAAVHTRVFDLRVRAELVALALEDVQVAHGSWSLVLSLTAMRIQIVRILIDHDTH